MSLWEDFLNNNGNAMCKWKHYFPAYESHFERFINRPVFLLEIGVNEGGSLQMWKRYFGPHALIVGIDINSDCAKLEEDQVFVRLGDQANTEFLQSILDEFGMPDIVIDDGSHDLKDVSGSFNYLYPRMSPNGVYFVEDVHTSYMAGYGGGVEHPDSFVELAKHLIDELNAEWTEGKLPATQFTRSTLSMHFYDSCVVFEKGRHLPRTAPRTGGIQEQRKSWFSRG